MKPRAKLSFNKVPVKKFVQNSQIKNTLYKVFDSLQIYDTINASIINSKIQVGKRVALNKRLIKKEVYWTVQRSRPHVTEPV